MLTSSRGFTLMELLVALTLLIILSGSIIYAYEGLEEQGRYDAVRYEMAQIRNALLQFRRDSGGKDFPGQGIYDCDDDLNGDSNIINPAIDSQLPDEIADLGSSEKVAWCRSEANFWMLFVDPLAKGWNKDTHRGWNGPYLLQKNHPEEDDVFAIIDAYGHPYLLKDAGDEDKARIVSTGGDGVDAGEAANPCAAAGNSDDQVLCLLK